MAGDPQAPRAIRAGVLAHLERCPNAADTAAGIRQWWLPPSLAVDVEVVTAVLEELVSLGWLERATALSPSYAQGIYARA